MVETPGDEARFTPEEKELKDCDYGFNEHTHTHTHTHTRTHTVCVCMRQCVGSTSRSFPGAWRTSVEGRKGRSEGPSRSS